MIDYSNCDNKRMNITKIFCHKFSEFMVNILKKRYLLREKLRKLLWNRKKR